MRPLPHWSPMITLMVLSPVLTELLTGNFGISFVWTHPFLAILFPTIGYGFPVLIFREIAIRQKMGLTGLGFLGFAYGIFNEGILAKTFFLTENLPINAFDHYGVAFGFSVPWALLISIWHALHAVIYPILIVYFLFPVQMNEPWVSIRACWGMGVPTVAFGVFGYFVNDNNHIHGQAPQLLLMVSVMLLCALLARQTPHLPQFTTERIFRWKPFFLGATLFTLLVVGCSALAGCKVPLPLFLGYGCALFLLLIWKTSSLPNLPLSIAMVFILGAEIMASALALIAAAGRGSLEGILTGIIFVMAFAIVLFRLSRPAKVL